MTHTHDLLGTSRLRFRSATPDDVAWLAALFRATDLRPFPRDAEPPNDADVAALLAEIAHAHAPHGLWLLEERAGAAIVGCVGLVPPGAAAEADAPHHGASEALIALLPAHRGQGHATEALAAVVHHAFERHGWTRLAAAIPVGDGCARRLAERLGFRFTSEVAGPASRLATWQLDRAGFVASDVLAA